MRRVRVFLALIRWVSVMQSGEPGVVARLLRVGLAMFTFGVEGDEQPADDPV